MEAVLRLLVGVVLEQRLVSAPEVVVTVLEVVGPEPVGRQEQRELAC